MLKEFDFAAIRRGAAGVLMFVLPAYVLVVALAAGNEESPLWLVMGAALLFGSTFGGYAGARDYPPTPISHGALSAAAGLAVALGAGLTLQLVKGDLTFLTFLTAFVMLQIGIGLGCLGGLLAAKGMRPR